MSTVKKHTNLFVTQFLIIGLLIVSFNSSYSQACDPSTPTFNIDLTGSPDSVWTSPPVTRVGLCCSASDPDRCIEFNITLDPNSQGIQLNLISGAIPGGSLFYEIDCANPTQVGDTLCLDGVGPHRVTFCKPGNNDNVYEIVAIERPDISDAIVVSDGCSGMIHVVGFDESTINWAPIPFDPEYVGYMSCTSGCDTVDISVTGSGYPAFLDFEVSGYPARTICDTALVKDTVRVYFVSDKFVEILPENPVVCFGGVNTTITANPNGGAPPYTYLWSTGETTQSIDVGVGTYWVDVFDTTNCPTVSDTVIVTAHLSPISVNAGLDIASCTNLPTGTLSGTVNVASGGIWSGGNGTYSPDNISLTVDYTPTPAEIIAGSVTHTLTTTGNDGCPAESDVVTQVIEPAPTVDAGSNQTVCGDVGSIDLTGSFSNAGGVMWSGGTGSFGNANNPITTYTPSSADTAAGIITLTLTTTLTGACNAVSDVIDITFTPLPKVNAGTNQVVCADIASVSLAGNVTIATGGTWTSSGTGTFSPDANTLTAIYIPSALDTTSGGVTLTLTSTGNGNCNAYNDQMDITFYSAPGVNAGVDQTVCGDLNVVTLNPNSSNSSSFAWTTSGTGTFSPDASTENATYAPTSADTASGNVTLTLTVTSPGCQNYSDDLTVTITDVPSVDAGSDITTCKDVTSITLDGSVMVATGGDWSTSGSGTFSPFINSLTGEYTPSAADTAAGSVTLTLTTTGNGTCNTYNDDVLITLTEVPTVYAGIDQTVCADVASVALNGIVTTATGGIWSSSGTGTFLPSNTDLNATYTPSDADTTNGSVTLTLTTTGNGLCQAYSDQMVITITSAPSVDAGLDQIVCADIAAVSLGGNVSIATGGIWTSDGTGTFSPNNTDLNANYIPSLGDTAVGLVTITLTSTGNGTCNTYLDDLTITLTDAPSVDAGSDITTCKDVTSITLDGSVMVATGGDWSTSGSGTFSPFINSLTGEYTPSAADTAAGSVTLTLTTTGNGTCNSYTDDVLITLTEVPTVYAGIDQTVCADVASVALNGIVTTATGGIWSSSGTGTFLPSNTDLNATYTPSDADTTNGSVTLTLTTTGNGLCQAYSDQMVITITSAPSVDAGSDQIVCADIAAVSLGGNVLIATGGIWTSDGTGTFSPNNTDLNADYIPSLGDTAVGLVTITLTSTGNGTCNTYMDDLTITLTDAPSVDAGSDITTCKDITSITLDGSVMVATGGDWSTSGSGTFSPFINSLTGEYTPSAADTAAGSVTLTLTTTGNGTCNTYTDDVLITLTEVPTVYAGIDQTICADVASVALNGIVTTATGGIWSSSGTGTFLPSNTDLNATYTPSDADTTIGSVTLTLTTTGNGLCQAYSDQMVITITSAPSVNAGSDQIVCADIAAVSLGGNVSIATGGIWTSDGTGTFSPNNTDLNANYIPSLGDTAVGLVTITLTSTGNGTCNTYMDDLTITLTDAPSVDAGSDITTCKDITSISLDGSVVVATGGDWSTSGSGTFNPNTSTLNADYIPSSADTTAGSVTLTLTTTGNGTCNTYTDDLVISLTELPNANAGTDQTVCADVGGVSLLGGITNATGGIWNSNGTGVFSPNDSTLNASYIISADDSAAGSVILTLSTTGNGNCQSYNDQMDLTINPAPQSFAGNDTSVCVTNPIIPLNGNVLVASGGEWSSNGSGTFTPNITVLNPTYTPSNADLAAGLVEIYLTTTGNGLCNPVVDTLLLTITPTNITVFAGNDTLVCGDDSLSLNGAITIATGAVWSSLGDGYFTMDSTDLNANYQFGPNDTVVNSVELVLTTTGNGGCLAQTDTILVDIQDPLTLGLSALDSVCRNGNVFNISSTTSTGQGYWATLGDGTFTDSTLLNTEYFSGPNDTTQSSISVYFTTQNNGVCTALTDTLEITYVDAPTVNFGFNLACLNDSTFFSDSSSAIGGIGNWDWTINDTITSNDQNPVIAFTEFGSHTVDLVIESGYGCKDSITQVVTVHPLPIADYRENALCYVDSVTLSDLSTIAAGSNVGWEWNVENGVTGNQPNLTVAFDSAGTYSFSLIVTSNMGCTDTIIDSLDVRPNPIAAFNSDTVCLNDSTTFTDLSTVEFGQVTEWQWIFGNGIDSIQNPTNVFDADSTHQVTLIVTSNIGCSDTVTQPIFINSIPNTAYSYIGFCEEDNVEFTDETTINSGQIVAWNWSFGNNTSTNQHPTNGFGNFGTYPVSLITTSDAGCTDTLTQDITISPNPTAEFDINPSVAQVLNDVTFIDESIDSYVWHWDFGDDLGESSIVNPVYAYDDFGIYTISLYIENEFGCTDSISHPITVKQPPQTPTAFSPNDDGLNDTFNVLGGTFIEFSFEIYNNWGKKIFTSNDPLEGWDGKFETIEQPLGVYVFVYRVVTEDRVEYNGHGDVTLMR